MVGNGTCFALILRVYLVKKDRFYAFLLIIAIIHLLFICCHKLILARFILWTDLFYSRFCYVSPA